MATIEEYLKHADAHAQETVNAWGLNVKAGNGDSLTPEFLDIFEKALRYQEAKGHADFFRFRNAGEEREESERAEEKKTRRTFIEAFKRG